MQANIEKIKNKIVSLPLPLKTSLIYVCCSILQKGVAFIAVPIYTRLISTEQYGIYSLYQSWDSILCIFATLNMWNYLFNNGMLKYEKDRSRFTSALIGLSGLLTGIIFVVYLFFHQWFTAISGLSFGIMMLMFLEFLLKPSYEYWCSRQRFEYDVKRYAIAAISITVLTPIVSVALILFSNKNHPEQSGTALIFAKVACAGIIYFVVMLSLLKKNRKLYDKEIWKYALNYNVPLIPHFLSGVILSQSDRIMIGNMCGKAEAGIYSVAYSVAAVLLIVNAAVMDSIIPWTYKCLKKQDYSKLPMVSGCALFLIAGLNILVAICAPEIISIMAPEEYQIAKYIIPPVAISNVFIFMFNLYANIEYFYEETKLVAVASCFSAIANIVLNYIFIDKFGFIAAGYTTIACYILYALCHFIFMKYVLRKNGIKANVYNNYMLWTIGIAATVIAIFMIAIYPYFIIRAGIVLLAVILALMNFKKILNFFLQIKKDKE